MTERGWVEQALCARLATRVADRLFFVEQGEGNRQRARAAARRLCDACPAAYDCLAEAVASPAAVDRYGIRGGLTPRERASLRPDQPQTISERLRETGPWIGGPTTWRDHV